MRALEGARAGRWVAVLRPDGAFDHLIDREAVLERVALQVV